MHSGDNFWLSLLHMCDWRMRARHSGFGAKKLVPAPKARAKLVRLEEVTEMTEIAGVMIRRTRCARGISALVRRGSSVYERQAVLPRLLPVASAELTDISRESTQKLCLRLASALRHERQRGRAGHWTYDLNRHLALLQAYRAERARLAELRLGDILVHGLSYRTAARRSQP
jgi:hypothetical protein